MMIFDPIADLLTRVRNAVSAKHQTVEMPASNIKKAIADVLVSEGYVEKVEILEDGAKKNLKITLKYGPDNEKVIQGIKRISKPGLRIFSNADELPQVLNGLGVAIVSTNKGVMSDKEARKHNVGGEVIAFVW
ncbi:MAG: 30S ribosomal protein S8 [Clostridia bacterium]|nr:30S ribosomal protein S8 [Clostridia bacterium]